jgi:hypothetical protein
MNREYLLDSLDGFKALVFRLLLPRELTESIACVPMTTDGPWKEAERAVFAKALGLANERMFWSPGGFPNVPPSRDGNARSKWVDAVATINHRYLFLDPDIGFGTHHNGKSEKRVLIAELDQMLRSREALIVYRHQYWPNPPPDDVPPHAHPYVWHGLRMLKTARLAAVAYQSLAASFFFVSKQEIGIEPFHSALQLAFAEVSAEVVAKRLVRRSRL